METKNFSKKLTKQQMVKHQPPGGWRERTWYLVETCYYTDNEVSLSLLYTGFLCEETGNPLGYNCVIPVHGGTLQPKTFGTTPYIYPIKSLLHNFELEALCHDNNT